LAARNPRQKRKRQSRNNDKVENSTYACRASRTSAISDVNLQAVLKLGHHASIRRASRLRKRLTKNGNEAWSRQWNNSCCLQKSNRLSRQKTDKALTISKRHD